jgi:glycosyltransferase involved in cell wall biosynthesis
LKVSLVIPVLNESQSLINLIESVKYQTILPDEVIFVDGGSTDNTVELIKDEIDQDHRFRVIEIKNGTPGQGRNVGVENAEYKWIAFTDGGIILEPEWLENLVKIVEKNPATDCVYGNVAPIIKTVFEKCAALAYVPPEDANGIRRSIASCLLKKEVWLKIGGFPDLRAAEDLIFMEAIEKQNFRIGYAPKALVHWELRQGFFSTFQKFVLYSKHNVFAGRQATWHYGILRQYLVIAIISALAIFHSVWWVLLILAWIFLRTAKTISTNSRGSNRSVIFNPIIFFGVLLLILIIDFAAFVGWGQATFQKKKD